MNAEVYHIYALGIWEIYMIKNNPIIFSILGALLVFNAEGMRFDSYPVPPDQRYVKVSFQILLEENTPLDQMTCRVFKELPPEMQKMLYELIANQSNEELHQELEKTQIALEQERQKLENMQITLVQEHKKADARLAEINKLGVTCNDLKIQLDREKKRTRQLERQLAAPTSSADYGTGNMCFNPLNYGLRRYIKSQIWGFCRYLPSVRGSKPPYYSQYEVRSTLELLLKLDLVEKTSERRHDLGDVAFYSAELDDGIFVTPAITRSPCLWKQVFLCVDENNVAQFDISVFNYNPK